MPDPKAVSEKPYCLSHMKPRVPTQERMSREGRGREGKGKEDKNK